MSSANVPWPLIMIFGLFFLALVGALLWAWWSNTGNHVRHPDDDSGPRTVEWLEARVKKNPRPPIPQLGATLHIRKDELPAVQETLRVPPYAQRHIDRALVGASR